MMNKLHQIAQCMVDMRYFQIHSHRKLQPVQIIPSSRSTNGVACAVGAVRGPHDALKLKQRRCKISVCPKQKII